MPDYSLEMAAGGIVAGVDEAGRGPWAGPVVAAAVILEAGELPAVLCEGLDDSKRLSRRRRQDLYAALPDHARIGIGEAAVAEIDTFNILQATMLAMARAVTTLGAAPDVVLVDGNRAPTLACPVECVVRGDGRSLSIAAASIVAKVTRDRIMVELAEAFPGYGWERNAGYGTPEHRAALLSLGVTRHHRRSFKPVLNMLGAEQSRDQYIESPRFP